MIEKEKKKRWKEEAEERRRQMRGSQPKTPEFQENQLPSYRRKKIDLKDFPIDSDQVKLSDIAITPENNMLKNNFLNDNPD